MSKFKKQLILFATFFKIGLFTFGGGYAMIPLIKREITEKHGWIGDEDILDIIALSESTPGPIAINMATFIGNRIGGFLGAAASTLGVVLPSFIIIFAISAVLREFQQIEAVKFAFMGIRAGVLALLLKALLSKYKSCKKSLFAYIIMAAAFLTVAVVGAFGNISVLWVILGCAAAGLIHSLVVARRAEK